MKKPVISYEDRYLVSSEGKIFSASRTHRRSDGVTRSFKEREMKPGKNRGGYANVALYKDGKATPHRVHRIVMMAFSYIEGCEKLDVNHKNGNKLDNRIENLEWCTRSENLRHNYRVLNITHSNTGKFGALHHRSKKIIGIDKSGEAISFDSLMDADRAGFSASKICMCIQGKRNYHKGRKWFDALSYSPPNLAQFLGK